MKRNLLLLGALALFLTACSPKKQVKILSSSEQNSIKAKAEQLQKDNKSILQKAEDNQVVTRTFVFPKDDKGTQQTQIVTYVGNTFKKLQTINVTATDEELKKGIQQVGLEEAQNQLRDSFNKDDAFKEALTVPGFTADLTLENENEYKVTITYDFEANLIHAGASEQK